MHYSFPWTDSPPLSSPRALLLKLHHLSFMKHFQNTKSFQSAHGYEHFYKNLSQLSNSQISSFLKLSPWEHSGSSFPCPPPHTNTPLFFRKCCFPLYNYYNDALPGLKTSRAPSTWRPLRDPGWRDRPVRGNRERWKAESSFICPVTHGQTMSLSSCRLDYLSIGPSILELEIISEMLGERTYSLFKLKNQVILFLTESQVWFGLLVWQMKTNFSYKIMW